MTQATFSILDGWIAKMSAAAKAPHGPSPKRQARKNTRNTTPKCNNRLVRWNTSGFLPKSLYSIALVSVVSGWQDLFALSAWMKIWGISVAVKFRTSLFCRTCAS